MIDVTVKMHHAVRAKAEKIAATLAAEYPLVTIEPQGDEIDHDRFAFELTSWCVLFNGEVAGELDAKGLELDAVLDAVVEAGFDPESTEEVDDEAEAGSGWGIARYKLLYAEVSENGRNCGDWLASFINGQCLVGSGKTEILDVEKFANLLRNNGVQMAGAKWAQSYVAGVGARGWQGRFRMSGRVVLEKTICQNAGRVFGADGVAVQMPADALEALLAKHSKALAKLKRGTEKAAATEEVGA